MILLVIHVTVYVYCKSSFLCLAMALENSWTWFFFSFLLSLFRDCLNPKIKGAVVFHDQGPELFDYSIRLNHTWAFSGFPDVKTIMDTNGPYLNDLELGVNIIPTMQYSFSGFLTVWQLKPLSTIVIILFCLRSSLLDCIVRSICSAIGISLLWLMQYLSGFVTAIAMFAQLLIFNV